MTYEQVKHLKPHEFKRLCGVHQDTFAEMVSVLRRAEQQTPPGRPPKLSLEDRVLLTLEYGREYRTYFHIAKSWGLHESTAYRTIRQVEDLLIHSGVFTLPGKKQLQASEHQIEVVMVDVTETPIERPKKNKSASTLAKRNGTH